LTFRSGDRLRSMSITDPALAASMRKRLGDRLTHFTGSLDDAPLELMTVSPVDAAGSGLRGFWHLYNVHGRTVARSTDAHVVASRLEQCLSRLETVDASPFQTWLDAITVTSRDTSHIVDAQVLASPAELMRAIRRGSLDLDEAMFTNLQAFVEYPGRERYVHVVEPDFEAVGADTFDPTPLSEAEVAWKLAQMAWRAAIRLWPEGADPTEHSQAVLDSIDTALRDVDGGWRHRSSASLTAWLIRNG
jgi:hypothetical protein